MFSAFMMQFFRCGTGAGSVVGAGQYVQLHPLAQAEAGWHRTARKFQVGTGGAGGGIEVLAGTGSPRCSAGGSGWRGGRQVARTIIETPEVGGAAV